MVVDLVMDEGSRRSTCTETESEEAVVSLASVVVTPLPYLCQSGVSANAPSEWTNQHACGGNEDNDPHKPNCNLVIHTWYRTTINPKQVWGME